GGLVLGVISGWRGAFGRFLNARPLRFIGTIGYGIYVYHVFLPALALTLQPRVCAALGIPNPGPGPRVFAIILVGIVSVPVLSWYLFERPINRLAARWLGPCRARPERVWAEDAVSPFGSAPTGSWTVMPEPAAIASETLPGPAS